MCDKDTSKLNKSHFESWIYFYYNRIIIDYVSNQNYTLAAIITHGRYNSTVYQILKPGLNTVGRSLCPHSYLSTFIEQLVLLSVH